MIVFEEDLEGSERFPRLIDEPGLSLLISSVSILTEKTLTKRAFRKIGLEPLGVSSTLQIIALWLL